MRAASGCSPVKCVKAPTAWPTAMPPPSLMRQPSARAARSSSVSSGKYTISDTHRSRRSSAAASGMPGSLSMPVGVACTRPLAPASAAPASGVQLARRPPYSVFRRSARALARAVSLSTSTSCCTPMRSAACAMAEPAPPAPSSTTRDRSASGSARSKPQRQPEPSVLWPTSRPSRCTTVLTAPIAAASSLSASSSGITACLQG